MKRGRCLPHPTVAVHMKGSYVGIFYFGAPGVEERDSRLSSGSTTVIPNAASVFDGDVRSERDADAGSMIIFCPAEWVVS